MPNTTMELLDCTTLRIEEFVDQPVRESYSILSHHWKAGEVTYQEVANPKDLNQKAR